MSRKEHVEKNAVFKDQYRLNEDSMKTQYILRLRQLYHLYYATKYLQSDTEQYADF